MEKKSNFEIMYKAALVIIFFAYTLLIGLALIQIFKDQAHFEQIYNIARITTNLITLS